ncbi:hypothetical protein P5673_007125 [Acropora cervicornis]|uniref:Uncharacterized protein n=1 Tax=Acropora cervicornis TaxID=6130 RepID=A0AAD9QVG1_ACRCE|nr:hypothetical protein P5673_007125 [Acropora cervicornis]
MIDQNQTLQDTIRSMNEAMERRNGQILELQNQVIKLANPRNLKLASYGAEELALEKQLYNSTLIGAGSQVYLRWFCIKTKIEKIDLV